METEPQTNPALSLRVDVADQLVHLLSDGAPVKSWPVSTSKFGLGTEPGSFRTPCGRFRICEKIGAGARPWTVFKGRVETGGTGAPGGEEDGILTRILWLEGLDESNANTRERYIYFHGTNQEDRIGTPASHGCIRLRNDDIRELFDLVSEGVTVEIA